MPDAMKQHIMNLLTSTDPDVRRLAAEELGTCETDEAISALAAGLWDENKGVRDAAARSLCNHDGAKVAQAIVDLIRDENIVTRNLIGELLLRWGKGSIQAIVPYMQDQSCDVRKFAVDILGLIGNADLIPDILPLLDDSDENVVLAAVEALGNIGDKEALPHLIRTFESQEYTKTFTAEAIGKIGSQDACDFLVITLQEELGKETPDALLMYAVIEALGICGNEFALKLLQDHVLKVEGKLRNVMLQSMVQIGERLQKRVQFSNDLKQDLINAFQSEEGNGKIAAAKGLAQFNDHEVVRLLISAVGTSEELDTVIVPIVEANDESFRIAVEVLQRTRASRTAGRKEIIRLLSKVAARFIREFPERKVFPLDDSLFNRAFELVAREWGPADEQARAVIIDTLFRLDGDRAVEFMDNVMADPDRWLRIHAIELLAGVADKRAPQFIARFLNDEDEMVREVAASSLQLQSEAY